MNDDDVTDSEGGEQDARRRAPFLPVHHNNNDNDVAEQRAQGKRDVRHAEREVDSVDRPVRLINSDVIQRHVTDVFSRHGDFHLYKL